MTIDANVFEVASDSPARTLALGECVGRSLVGGLVLGLVGPLGAGKTQLVKGIARGNEAAPETSVTSPTFTLVHEYAGRLTLYHADVYRLRGAAELLGLGFDEWMRPDAAVVVEWADRMRDVLPDDTLWVTCEVTGDERRTLRFEARGELSGRALETLRREIC